MNTKDNLLTGWLVTLFVFENYPASMPTLELLGGFRRGRVPVLGSGAECSQTMNDLSEPARNQRGLPQTHFSFGGGGSPFQVSTN